MLRKTLSCLGAVATLAAGPAFAQGTQAATGPGSIPVGPLTVYPGIDLAHGHDDNLTLRLTDRISSSNTVVSPYMRAEMKSGPHKFDAGMRADHGRYHSSAADNYTDYALTGAAALVFSGRASLKLKAEHRLGHDNRGSTDRGVSQAPDEYDNSGIDGIFSYGASGARGRIELSAGAYARRYSNNRLTTAAADRDTVAIGGTFYWRVMPRTELLAQVVHTNNDYRLGASTQDSTENRYLAGVKWEATAKTTGIAKFGRMDKKFDSSTRQSVSGNSSWDVGVRWSPLTYSVFDFVTTRQTGESTGVGDSVIGSTYSATWSHAWNSRFRTQAVARLNNDRFVGAGVAREDDTSTFGLKAAYDFRRWLRFGADYSYSERDSSGAGLNYKRNQILFTVGATL